MKVEETLFVVRETPLGHDGPSTRNNASHACGGARDVAQEHASVDCEIVNTLLRLLNERVTEELPREESGPAQA